MRRFVEGVDRGKTTNRVQCRAWACDPNRHFEAHTKYLQLADKASRTVAVLAERLDQHRVLDLTENKSPGQAGFDRGH